MKTFHLVLALLFMTFQTVNSQQNNQLLAIEVIGTGQPIILIHGMSCSAEVWGDLVTKYKDDYELHLVSIKGFGNKEKLVREHYLRSIKDELISYTKSNNLESPIILGHSMGGFLALWAAADEPDLFAKIVSVDGVPYFPVLQMPGITPENAAPIVAQMTSSMSNMSLEQLLQNQKMMVSTMIATEEKRAKIVEMGMNSHPEVVGQAYGEMYTTDIRAEMQKVKIPVLVFGAWAAYQNFGATKTSVTAGYEDQFKDIPQARILVADSAYHFVFYDEPDWFYAELDSFLDNK